MTCLKKNLKYNLTLVLLLSFACLSTLFGAELITGDENAAEGQTFSFTTGPYGTSGVGDHFYVAAALDAGDAKEFALSRVERCEKAFKPLAPKYVQVNGVDGQENPLYNSGFAYLSLLENKKESLINTYPVLVPADTDPTELYVVDLSKYHGSPYSKPKEGECVDTTKTKIAVVEFTNIKDANAENISRIDGIESTPVSTPGIAGAIFAAVRGNGQAEFGQPGSGIATVGLFYNTVARKRKRLEFIKGVKNIRKDTQNSEFENSENQEGVEQVRAKMTAIVEDIEKLEKEVKEGLEEEKLAKKVILDLLQVGNAAIPLDVTSAVAKINSDLESMAFGDMYWDNVLGCLFIALKNVAGGAPDAGTKALVLGKFKDGVLELKNIVSNDVFQDQNEIIGAVGADSQVSLHKVRTMHTSTRLPYVIVLGGNGEPENTRNTVYALPLVNNPGDDTHGMIASKNSVPEDVFKGDIIKRMRQRLLKGAAITNDDMTTQNDFVAQVGGLNPFDYQISDIFVIGDAVFGLVEAFGINGSLNLGSLYMSRALFDENGKIKSWTEWQRVSSSLDPIFGASVDPQCGNFIFVSSDSELVDGPKTVKRTVWGTGDANGLQHMISAVNSEFPSDLAGIQGLFEFSCNNKEDILQQITMLVATGYKKVVLVNVAQCSNGDITRNIGDIFEKQTFTGGTLTTNANAKVLSISGGALDAIGPIEAAAVTVSGSNGSTTGRLFVGGASGLAVLVDSNGDGWATDLGENFAGLNSGMGFKLLGDFKFVRKLLYLNREEDNYLFILTDEKLYRVDLDSGDNDFANGVIDAVEIANFDNVPGMGTYGTFLDFAASGKLGILATSMGLFRVGNEKDIVTDTDLFWTQVTVPTYCGPIKQLLPVSMTLKEQDVFGENTNGVLYVLCAYYGNNIAQFNRFTVNYAEEVGKNTIQPLPDYFVADPQTGKGSSSYFVHYGTFRELILDEGAFRFSAADRDISIPPFVKLLLPGNVSGAVLPIVASTPVTLSIENNSDVVKILRSVTGPTFVAGDFGLKVNE